MAPILKPATASLESLSNDQFENQDDVESVVIKVEEEGEPNWRLTPPFIESSSLPSSAGAGNDTHASDNAAVSITATLKEFTIFAKLPLELQLTIWEFARPGPRMIRPLASKDHRSWYSPAPIPSMLHACQQSRRCALKWYTLGLASSVGISLVSSMRGGPGRPRGKIYFDYNRDFIYVDATRLCVQSPDDGARVRNVAVQLSSPIIRYSFLWAELWYRDLREVMVIAGDQGMSGSWAEMREFVEVKDEFKWQKGWDLMALREWEVKRRGEMTKPWQWSVEKAWRGAYVGSDRSRTSDSVY